MRFRWYRKLSYYLHPKRIDFIRRYIEAGVSENAFFQELSRRRIYQKLYYRASWDDFCSPLVSRELVIGDLQSLSIIEKISLQSRLCTILDYYNVNYAIKVPELAFWEKWKGYIPSFLDPSVELMEEMESFDPNQKRTKKWHKERLRRTYPYEKYPPRWLQNCDWPLDDDGGHCLFLYQTGYPNSTDYIEYHFRKSTGEELVVTQYD